MNNGNVDINCLSDKQHTKMTWNFCVCVYPWEGVPQREGKYEIRENQYNIDSQNIEFSGKHERLFFYVCKKSMKDYSLLFFTILYYIIYYSFILLFYSTKKLFIEDYSSMSDSMVIA